jgi:hypothetical protein
MRWLTLRAPENVGPFSALLATLAATLLLTPFVSDDSGDVSRFRFFGSAVILAGIYAVSRRRILLFAGLALALPAIALEWWLALHPAPALVIAHFALSLGFLCYTAAVILYTILDEERVTLDTVLGGISVYLLLGLIWVLAYSMVEHLAPGSFRADGAPLPRPRDPGEFRQPDLMYFSYVTLTTVGYGDVLAKTTVARALAAAEAVTGSLYLAVFVARLVGLHLAHHQRRDLDL